MDAGERDVFREAYPQCFRLFPEGSAEHDACLVVLPWHRALGYDDDALTALVRRETRPTPAGEAFRDLFPRCFSLFGDGTWERRACIEVSADHGYARYGDGELRQAVEDRLRRYDRALREAEQSRRRETR